VEFERPETGDYTITTLHGVEVGKGTLVDEKRLALKINGAVGVYMMEIVNDKNQKSIIRIIKH